MSRVFMAVVVSVLLVSQAWAAQFRKVVSFGDSLSDTGNVYLATLFDPASAPFPPSPPYFPGHFTNGPNWVEYLSLLLGTSAGPPLPSLLGGTNYAWGGAETGINSTSTVSTLGNPIPGSFPVSAQVSQYLETLGPVGQVPRARRTLFTLWAGANDFLFREESDPSVIVQALAFDVQRLIDAGAKHILVPNIPSLDATPGGSGAYPSALVTVETNPLLPPRPNRYDAVVAATNTGLAQALDVLDAANPSVNIYQLDVAGLMQQVIADPTSVGLPANFNTTVPALNEPALYGLGQVVFNANPNNSLFWDGAHPTTLAHGIISLAAFDLLTNDGSLAAASLTALVAPEPSSLGLFMVAAVTLIRRPRHRV